MADQAKAPQGLYAKVAAAQAAVSALALEKAGHAEIRSDKASYDYDYFTEAQLMAVVREHLSSRGVAVMYSCTACTWQGTMAVVNVQLTLADADSKDTLVLFGMGAGADRGDKALGKAQTSGLRYLLWKLLLAGDEQAPDPEQQYNDPQAATSDQLVRIREYCRDLDALTGKEPGEWLGWVDAQCQNTWGKQHADVNSTQAASVLERLNDFHLRHTAKGDGPGEDKATDDKQEAGDEPAAADQPEYA